MVNEEFPPPPEGLCKTWRRPTDRTPGRLVTGQQQGKPPVAKKPITSCNQSESGIPCERRSERTVPLFHSSVLASQDDFQEQEPERIYGNSSPPLESFNSIYPNSPQSKQMQQLHLTQSPLRTTPANAQDQKYTDQGYSDDDWSDEFNDSDGNEYGNSGPDFHDTTTDDFYDVPDREEIPNNVPPKVLRSTKPIGIRPTPTKPSQTKPPQTKAKPNIPLKPKINSIPKPVEADKKTPMMMRNNFGQGFPKFGSQSFGTHKNDNNNNNNKNNKMVQKPVPLLPNDRISVSNKFLHEPPADVYEVTDHVSERESYVIPPNQEMYIVPNDNDYDFDQNQCDAQISHGPTKSLPPPPSHQDPPISASHFLHRINTLKNNFEKQSPQPHFGQEETYEVCDSGPEALDPVQRSRNNSNSSQMSNASIRSNSSTPGTSRENSFRNNSNKHTKLPSPMENRPLPISTDETEEYEVVHSPKFSEGQESYEILSSSERPPMPLPVEQKIEKFVPRSNKTTSADKVNRKYVGGQVISSSPPPHQNNLYEEEQYEEPGYDSSLRSEERKTAPALLPRQKPVTVPVQRQPSLPVDTLRRQKPHVISHDSAKPVPPPTIGQKPVIEGGGKPSNQNKISRLVDTVASAVVNSLKRNQTHQVVYPTPTTPFNQNPPVPINTTGHNYPTNYPANNNHPAGLPQSYHQPAPIPATFQCYPARQPDNMFTNFPLTVSKNVPSSLSANGYPTNIAVMTQSSYRQATPVGIQATHQPPIPKAEDTLLINCSWYHGKVNRQESERILLERKKEGGFIVRETDKGSGYSISIFHFGVVTHLRIPMKDDEFLLGSSKKGFTSVQELVKYYRTHQIQLTSGGNVFLAV